MSLAAEQPSSVGSPVVPVSPGASSPSTSRRTLRFESLAEILGEVESIAGMDPVPVGAWTPAQNIDHVRLLIRFSREGGAIRLPLAIRVLGRLMKSKFLTDPARPGFKTADPFLPADDVSLEDALTAFRDEVRVASQPGAMSQSSPLLGRMTHEKWEQLHCRHAELHLGFIVPNGGPEGGAA